MDDYRYGTYSRLTILTRKHEYLVGGPQDGACGPNDNSNHPGGNQVPGLEQHNDGRLHMYSPVLLFPGLNTYLVCISFL